MEFHEKLQELRKQRGLTQEQLAAALYVSRTAISKWESGRGYPNIDSLKAIAKFFAITVDALLSGDELLSIAQEDGKQARRTLRDLVYGLLDLGAAMLLFLPLFATKSNGAIQSASLISLDGVQPYLKASYFVAAIATIAMGVLTLALQGCTAAPWLKSKTVISLILGTVLLLLLTVSLQPYAAVLAFVLLAIKALMLLKRT